MLHHLDRLRGRRRSSPVLHWDGQRLVGDPGSSRTITVTIPIRLALVRSDTVPAAALALRRQAVRLKAERHTAVLGPAVVDAVIAEPRDGACAVLLAAVPQTVIDAVRHAAAPRRISAIHLAECLGPIDAKGVAGSPLGETAFIDRRADGFPVAIIPLGKPDDPGFSVRLNRERLRSTTAVLPPSGPTVAATLDFLAPGLTAATPWSQRPALRLGLLGGGIAAALLLATVVVIVDALSARADARAELARLAPLADVLTDKRADLAEVRPWFDDRPAMLPALVILAQGLPAGNSSDSVRLNRVRQIPESAQEPVMAEGIAGERSHLLAYVARLRDDVRVASAEVRSFRSPGAGTREVSFELALRLRGQDEPSATGAAHGTP